MAEGTNEEGNSWENWLGGWVQTAKEKSSHAYEFVKKDLAEFSTTLQKETEKAIEKTSTSLTRENTEQATTKVKAGISSFLSNVSKALVIPPADDYVPVKISADGSTLYDRGKARLHAIQLDASTYVDPPRGSPEQFEMWLNSFDMDLHKGEISEILVSKVEVRALYTKLVPNEVSHAEFWQRYFYRVHQLQCDEERKKALMQRADQTHGDSLSWDDDDWSAGEEDEGHESDWEKMPKPQQQQPLSDQSLKAEIASSSSISPPSDPCSSSSQKNICTPPSDSTNSTDNTDNVTQSEHHGVSQEVSNTNSTSKSCDRDSTSFLSENSDSDLETVHNHFSADCSHPSTADAPTSDIAATTEADPVSRVENLEISADTASACTSSVVENAQGPEPGSPAAEIPGLDNERDGGEPRNPVPHPISHQTTGASSGAAASGDEPEPLPVSDDRNIVMGDAACGASDVLSSPSSSSTTLNENNASQNNTPEASPAFGDSNIPNEDTSLPKQDCADSPSNTTKVTEAPPSEPSASANNDKIVKDENDPDLAMRVKGDMVVVGETDTPSSDSSEAKGLDDDWEEDFDVEVTEEDLKAAEEIAKKLGENLDTEDDWENWD